MQVRDLCKFFEKAKSNKIKFKGPCHDCGKEITIKADWGEDWKMIVSGGALYYPKVGETEDDRKLFAKCPGCFEKNPTLRNYQPCEVYSRVVGYLRPVSQWNDGKQAEFGLRKTFTV